MKGGVQMTGRWRWTDGGKTDKSRRRSSIFGRLRRGSTSARPVDTSCVLLMARKKAPKKSATRPLESAGIALVLKPAVPESGASVVAAAGMGEGGGAGVVVPGNGRSVDQIAAAWVGGLAWALGMAHR